MNDDNNYRPGFPGDGDSDIELHHDDPDHWTKKDAVWSTTMIVIAILLAAGAILLAANRG